MIKQMKWDKASLKPQIRALIINNLVNKYPEENLENNYRLFFYDIILKLIMYFQPFDIKLPAINQVNSDIKSYCVILPRSVTDDFIHNVEYNQIGDVVVNQIRKRLFEQFQILKEIEGCQ